MTATMFVIPAAGLLIRDPVRLDIIPPEGREVPAGDLHYERLIMDCDMTRGEAPAAPADKKR